MTNKDENSQEYWEKILTESGLSMNRGRPPQRWVNRGQPNEYREDIVAYVGTSYNLVGVEEEQLANEGRVIPEGHSPD